MATPETSHSAGRFLLAILAAAFFAFAAILYFQQTVASDSVCETIANLFSLG